jgi:hypothetical protein
VSQDGHHGAPDDSSTGSSDGVGSVGEEAAKLLGALSEWAKDHGSDLGQAASGLAGHAARSAQGMNEHLATGAAECAYCPICRTVHALRETSPEVRAQLATAATALLQAASGLLATAVPDTRRDPSAGVERIDLDDGPDDRPDWPDDDPEEGDR